MKQQVGPPIRQTCGKVVKYKERDGYGWVCVGDERWRDAFMSYREFEPDKDEKKFIEVGYYVKFDLHENEKGYVVKNAYRITEQEYNSMTGAIR